MNSTFANTREEKEISTTKRIREEDFLTGSDGGIT